MTQTILTQIVEGPLSQLEVLHFVGSHEHGGQAFFFGAVRNFNQGRRVLAIHYDIFTPLAMNILEGVVNRAQEQWDQDMKICAMHACGELKVGDISVGIGVSSRHRDEAFKACRYIIEEIKHQAPIWKKEIYEDGESEWVKGHALCCHNS